VANPDNRYARVTDRPCRECDGLGVLIIAGYPEDDEIECRECVGTGRELE
jgi:DnaJ-class molecular chaperone